MASKPVGSDPIIQGLSCKAMAKHCTGHGNVELAMVEFGEGYRNPTFLISVLFLVQNRPSDS